MNPRIIEFQKIGSDKEGFLSIASENLKIPFDIKRSFWTYKTPESIVRGRHAHHKTEMVLVAIKGKINIKTIDSNGNYQEFILNDPNKGLFIPKMCWHEMTYLNDAIQLVLCSSLYQESDYIRSLDVFKELIEK